MKLADVAIQTDPGDKVAYCIAVWAVSTNGDVYYRDSVHAAHPTVSYPISYNFNPQNLPSVVLTSIMGTENK